MGDVLNGLGVNGVSGGSADDRAGVPPGGYDPPLHGSNPHGEGTVASVDLFPSNNNPYPGSPSSGDEDIVIGDSRGEQNGSTYHGRVTIAYVNLLGLIGPVEVSRETNPGQTDNGPAGDLNTALQNNICGPSGNNICLEVLAMNSSTTNTGSNNSFQAIDLDLFGGLVAADALSSSGNIQESGGCQTSTGSSSIANANVGPAGLSVMPASSSSTACNNGQQTTTNSSSTGLGPALDLLAPGCNAGTANSEINLLVPLVGIVCNADDTNQGQTSNPYGVREALALFLVIQGNTSLIKLTLSGPESHAVAPPAGPTTTPAAGGPAGQKKKGGPDGEGEGGAAGAVAGDAAPGEGVLAFTGANLLALLLIGAGLIGLGLLAMAARERQTV